MKYLLFTLTICSLMVVSSCSDDDNEKTDSAACLAESIELTETKVEDNPDSNIVFLSFDVKNNASSDYSIVNGSPIIYATVIITTEDGSKYENEESFTITSLSSGATSDLMIIPSYGAGKTYSSYEISLSCK